MSDATWKNKFDELSEYREINGHCNIRTCENRPLYEWARKQRCLFDSGSLDKDRTRQLESIGFEWATPIEITQKVGQDAAWKNKFDELSEYRETNGHCTIRKCKSETLYLWARNLTGFTEKIPDDPLTGATEGLIQLREQ